MLEEKNCKISENIAAHDLKPKNIFQELNLTEEPNENLYIVFFQILKRWKLKQFLDCVRYSTI